MGIEIVITHVVEKHSYILIFDFLSYWRFLDINFIKDLTTALLSDVMLSYLFIGRRWPTN